MFHIVFLQTLAAKLHTKVRAEVRDWSGKDTDDDSQMAYAKVHKKGAKQGKDY